MDCARLSITALALWTIHAMMPVSLTPVDIVMHNYLILSQSVRLYRGFSRSSTLPFWRWLRAVQQSELLKNFLVRGIDPYQLPGFNGKANQIRTLHEIKRDVTKLWRRSGLAIAVTGLENQSRPDHAMPLRMIAYDGASYKSELLRIG